MAARRDDPEHREQVALINWRDTFSNIHPELKLLHSNQNARKCTPRQGKYLNDEGRVKGVPDLCLPIPRDGYSGLWIEMKADKTSNTTPEQKDWIHRLEHYGHKCVVCCDWTIGARIIQKYLGLPYSIVPDESGGVKRVWGCK